MMFSYTLCEVPSQLRGVISVTTSQTLTLTLPEPGPGDEAVAGPGLAAEAGK